MPAQHKKTIYCPVLCGLLPQRSMKIPPYPPLVKGGWGDFHINREYFPALKEAIDKAKREVALSFFRHNLTQSALKYNNEMSVMIESAEALEYIKSLLPNKGSRAR